MRNFWATKGHAGVMRGAALFLGLYAFFGLLVAQWHPSLDLNLWWIDVRLLPTAVRNAMLAHVSVALVLFSLGALRARWTRYAAALPVLAFALVAAINAAGVLKLALEGAIQIAWWVPISCLITFLLLWIARAMLRPASNHGASIPCLLAGFAAGALLFPIVQVIGFGKTDYERPADVAVVFGARVYADGRLSDAVNDRVTAAVSLFQRGLVRQLIMSGGPGDGAIHEAVAMKNCAVELGVPAESILLDLRGFNTASTVRNTRAALEKSRVIVVSEFYHLPRIKMTYAAAGLDVVTVPARARHWARNWPIKNIVREVPAFWVYLGRAAIGRI